MEEIIFYRVLALINEIGLQNPVSLVDDFDPDYSIKKNGEHILLEFHLEIRDDVDEAELVKDFRMAMGYYNLISRIKADLYEINDYPGPAKNWHTAYLTVTTI